MSGVHQKYINDEWVVIGIGDAPDDTPCAREGGSWIPLAGWRSVSASVAGSRNGSSAPALETFGPTGGVQQLAFAVGDLVYMSLRIPEDCAVDSDVVLVATYAVSSTDTEDVHIEITSTVASVDGVFAADVVTELVSTPPGVAWQLTREVEALAATVNAGDTFAAAVERITNGGTDNAGDVFPLSLDLWYQSTGLASDSAPS